MPQYDFRCPADLTLFTMYQSFEDNSIPNCSMCGQQMSKVFQATPAVFRGDGWAGKK
jgi:putative FmdB family regulatory protein